MVKNPPINAGDTRDGGLIPVWGRSFGEGNGNFPVFLPRRFHGQGNLAGYSPWGHKVSDKIEFLNILPMLTENKYH